MALKVDVTNVVTLCLVLGSLLSVVYTNDVVEVRNAFKCDDCTYQRCPAINRKCELVREPGICSCCLTCAREAGNNCGINLGRCGRGYKCRPKPGDPNPMLSLLVDTAVCQPIAPKPYSYQELVRLGSKY